MDLKSTFFNNRTHFVVTDKKSVHIIKNWIYRLYRLGIDFYSIQASS
jgi:hypothetical protein